MRTLSYKFNRLLTHYLLYNPAAGKIQRNPGWVPQILETLRANHVSVQELPTTGPGSARQQARECAERGAEVVFVAGGDGTIHDVVNGLVGSRTALGVLPGGTANCLAVELGIGTDPVAAARRTRDWKPRRIALGLCRPSIGDPRYFAVMAGAGVDAQIVREVNPAIKRRLGKVAYWIAGMSASLRRLPELEVTTLHGRSRASFALASRVKNYGGDLEIAKTIHVEDPRFETVLFEGRFAVRYLKYLAGVLINQHRGMKGVHVQHVERLELKAVDGERIYLQLDGEAFGELPASIEIVPDALTLLVPEPRR